MAIEPLVFEAIASARRRAILRLIWDQELPAGAIAAGFDVSWPAISQNLAVLRRAGVVTERREGTHRYYRADRTALGPLADVLRSMWVFDLAALKDVADAEDRRTEEHADGT